MPEFLKKQGVVYLIPNLLGGDEPKYCFPEYNFGILKKLKYFVVEEIRNARRFLRKIDRSFPIDECEFFELNEHTGEPDSENMLGPIFQGHSIGVISEAGLPCIADPGADLIFKAHKKNIRVIPLSGASSIFMALMASGLSGQQFCFHGYLPKNKNDLIHKIKKIESDSAKNAYAQIFIETPYKNNQMWNILLETCNKDTNICVASNITLPNEYIATKTVTEWKKMSRPDINKQPAIFILQSSLF